MQRVDSYDIVLTYCFITLSFPDSLLADPVSVHESAQSQFTEEVWYLPETRLCFTPPTETLSVSSLPALRNGKIAFGCFQNRAKINKNVLIVWGKIFHELPQARLRLQCKQLNDVGVCADLRQQLEAVGISEERVTFVGAMNRNKYLAAHAEVDMILDTFPFPGGTTTCEALWMGVPTLTLAGDTLLSRQGASLLTCAGLQDWVANDEDEYVAKAIAFASDLNALAELCAGLRNRVAASPLFDAPRFARHLEEALWGMWRRFEGKL